MQSTIAGAFKEGIDEMSIAQKGAYEFIQHDVLFRQTVQGSSTPIEKYTCKLGDESYMASKAWEALRNIESMAQKAAVTTTVALYRNHDTFNTANRYLGTAFQYLSYTEIVLLLFCLVGVLSRKVLSAMQRAWQAPKLHFGKLSSSKKRMKKIFSNSVFNFFRY
jgi:hypothetical protein